MMGRAAASLELMEVWEERSLRCVRVSVPTAMPTQRAHRAGANKVAVPLSHLGRAWRIVTAPLFVCLQPPPPALKRNQKTLAFFGGLCVQLEQNKRNSNWFGTICRSYARSSWHVLKSYTSFFFFYYNHYCLQ